jgi:hypothetical protein
MLYMAIMFSDPIIQLGLFICAYIIVTGVCTYFGYSPTAVSYTHLRAHET